MTASLRAKIFTKTSDGLLRALNNTRAVAFLVDIHEGVLRKDLMHRGNFPGPEVAIGRHTGEATAVRRHYEHFTAAEGSRFKCS